jgi:hypothetical protein
MRRHPPSPAPLRLALVVVLAAALGASGCDRVRALVGRGPSRAPTPTAAADDDLAALDREAAAGSRGVVRAAPAAEVAITPEKVKAFIVYQREISGAAGDLGGMFAGVARGGKASDALASPSGKGLAGQAQSALSKSGLTQEEVAGLTRTLATYYTKRMFVADAKRELARPKPKGRPGILDDMYRKQLEDGEKARAEFGRRHGQAALQAADQHEQEYLEIMHAMMKGILKPRR